MTHRATHTPQLENAYTWRARMADEGMDVEERRDFHAWLRADVENALAYDIADRLWDSLDAADEHLVPAILPAAPRRQRPGRFLAVAMAASIAAIVGFTGLFFSVKEQPTAPSQLLIQTFATGIGETREIALDDGSVITLGAKTRVDVTLGPKTRRVALSTGDAFFDVETDPVRPFLVTHADMTIRVTGTVFDVRTSGAITEVAVGEGSVAVRYPRALPDTGAGQAIKLFRQEILQAGERVEASSAAGLGEVVRFDPTSLATWRDAQLTYADAPITEILADADRYTDYHIIVENPQALQALRLSATFSAERIDRLLETLSYSYALTTEKTAQGDLVIRPSK